MKNKFLKHYTIVWTIAFFWGMTAIATLGVIVVFLFQGRYELIGDVFLLLLIFTAIFSAMFLIFLRPICTVVILTGSGMKFVCFGKELKFIAWNEIENCYMQYRGRLPEILVIQIKSKGKIKLVVNKQIINTMIELCPDNSINKMLELLTPPKFRWF